MSRQISKDAKVFKSRLIYAVNMLGAFWLGIAGYFAFLAFFASVIFQDSRLFQKNEILFAFLLANGIALVLVLVPGRLLAMWPYAVALEPQKGIWVYAPPTKLWIPLDEIIDIDICSGWYGAGHAIQLSQSHGLVKQLRTISLFFPDELLARELRALISRRDGVVYTS